jgi:hypothetical protein
MGKERKLLLSDFEHRLLINGMMAFRNQLMEEGKPTEDVNDLIIKILDAPRKRCFSREER